MADEHEDKPKDDAPAEPQLPVVWSPKLDATAESSEDFRPSADEAATEQAAEAGREGGASPTRSMRFAMLAASVAAAAALGSFVGSLSASGVAHVWPVSQVAATTGASAAKPDLSALKADLAGAAHNANGQFAKLADRLDRLEQAQSEPAAKLAQRPRPLAPSLANRHRRKQSVPTGSCKTGSCRARKAARCWSQAVIMACSRS
jgi:hypothetical protein